MAISKKIAVKNKEDSVPPAGLGPPKNKVVNQ